MLSLTSGKWRSVALGVGLTLSAGCGGYKTGEAAGDLAPARVFFDNESLEETAVYAVSGPRRTRIGTVMAGRTDTLMVPSGYLTGSGVFHLVARPLARSIAPDTGPLTLSPGDDLMVTLPADQNTLIALPARP